MIRKRSLMCDDERRTLCLCNFITLGTLLTYVSYLPKLQYNFCINSCNVFDHFRQLQGARRWFKIRIFLTNIKQLLYSIFLNYIG